MQCQKCNKNLGEYQCSVCKKVICKDCKKIVNNKIYCLDCTPKKVPWELLILLFVIVIVFLVFLYFKPIERTSFSIESARNVSSAPDDKVNVTIKNNGNKDIDISNIIIYLDGQTGLITENQIGILKPGEQKEFTVLGIPMFRCPKREIKLVYEGIEQTKIIECGK